VECGHHYVRSMASWGVFLAAGGFRFDRGSISFDPKINAEDFSTFFCSGKTWGIYRQTVSSEGWKQREIEVLYGDEKDVCLMPE